MIHGAQCLHLRAAGAEKAFRETANGAKSDRRQLAAAIKALADGDTLLVTRLDRLGALNARPVEHSRRRGEGRSRVPLSQ